MQSDSDLLQMESKGQVSAPPKEKEKAFTKERHPRDKRKQGDSCADFGEQSFRPSLSLYMDQDMEDILAQNRVTQEDIDALEIPEGNAQLACRHSLMPGGSVILHKYSIELQCALKVVEERIIKGHIHMWPCNSVIAHM